MPGCPELAVGKGSSCAQPFFGDPLLQESGTVPKLHTLAFASREKRYNVPINEHHFHKIEDCIVALLADRCLDHTEVFSPNSPAHAEHAFAIIANETFDLKRH
jgi:hypothetical protein